MDHKDKEQLDSILRVLYNDGDQAWYKVYTSLNLDKQRADHLYKIGKAFGYLKIIHKGKNAYPVDNQYVTLTDPGVAFFAMSSFSQFVSPSTPIPNSINIHNSGDGVVITSGNSNAITASITFKGDKKSVQTQLDNAGVSESDIEELLKFIDEEMPMTKDNFGERVNEWIYKMIGKALQGSWHIAANTAGGLLTDIIAKYYGI